MLINVTTNDEKGEAVCFNQFSFYIGGAGGFGGKRRSERAKSLVSMPSRAPDASIREKTSCCQAAFYRLSGDYNPIHIDPDFAQMGGTVLLKVFGDLSVKYDVCLCVCVCVCFFFFHDTSANKKKFSDGVALFGLSVKQQNTKSVQSFLEGKSRVLLDEQRLFNLLGMILEDQRASALRVAGIHLL